MNIRPSLVCLKLACGVTVAMTVITGAHARDFEMGGDSQYPNSIMAPEPGTHHRAAPSTRKSHVISPGRAKFMARRNTSRSLLTSRGSSGSVLPTPLPRTPLIPPEGGGVTTMPNLPQEQGPTTVPGLSRSVPNLPHGTETFQDRASRCNHQAGLYGVPNGATSQYMAACAM